MLSFLNDQIFLYSSIIIVFFVTGFSILYFTELRKHFSFIETILVSFGLSIATIDFLIILIGKIGISINRASLIISISLFSLLLYLIYRFIKKIPENKLSISKKYPTFSRKESTLIILILFLTIFIKTIYLSNAIFPTTTDLGHHMYWSKIIVESEKLPVYEELDIKIDGTISDSTPIADFIIGEHLPFSAIAILSKINLISSFPILILFIIQIITILTVFILTRYIFIDHKYSNIIAIFSLFFIGPIYAISSPQIKFASGGVIGNTIGNFLLPLSIFLFIKGFIEKKSSIISIAMISSLAMAYTHHLSTFVFIFIIFFSIIFFIIFNFKNIFGQLASIYKLLIKPEIFSILFFAIIFIIFIYTPTYLNTKAIDTAVGSPIKSTRTGLSISQLKSTAGEARLIFAILGIVFLFLYKKINTYAKSFLFGWIISLIIMTLRPGWLFIDIPSNRIASYIVFPVSILASFSFVHIFIIIKSLDTKKIYIKTTFLTIIFAIFMIFILSNGFFDNQNSLNLDSNPKRAIETYSSSKYLSQKTTKDDTIIKDHNYIAGDSWIKLFFMRGYNYPFSRGYFKRYQDETKQREQCTNLMISAPSSVEAQKCFNGTKTDFVIINPKIDSAQFKTNINFWQIYSSEEIGIFYKKN